MTNLGINDLININKKTKVKVSEIVNDKQKIFDFIKKGVLFDDEVLKIAGITKSISNEKIINVICEHKSDKKSLPKETESLKSILKSIHTINNEIQNSESEQEFINSDQNDEYQEE